MKWASISGVWDTTPFNREPLRTRFVVWVSGAECGSWIRPSPAFNGVALIPFLRGPLIICPISQGWWCCSFPNNLLLNFPADWPSSSTAYMLSQGDSTPGPTLERLSHQYYSAKQPLKENSFRWPSGDSNRGPSVPQSDSLPLDYRLASHGNMTEKPCRY